MQLPDRATDVLAELASRELDRLPLVFVCHSLGRLVVKQVLRIAFDQRATVGTSIFDTTRGVAFLGTPNMGAHLSNWADVSATGSDHPAARLVHTPRPWPHAEHHRRVPA
jgi:hypothetical protein